MNDPIKREDAIKAVLNLTMYKGSVPVDSVIYNIKHIPSAENKGEWIKHDEERDYCSVCKHIFKTRILTKQDKWTTYVDDLEYNFCPNCGARMRGADDETD